MIVILHTGGRGLQNLELSWLLICEDCWGFFLVKSQKQNHRTDNNALFSPQDLSTRKLLKLCLRIEYYTAIKDLYSLKQNA